MHCICGIVFTIITLSTSLILAIFVPIMINKGINDDFAEVISIINAITIFISDSMILMIYFKFADRIFGEGSSANTDCDDRSCMSCVVSIDIIIGVFSSLTVTFSNIWRIAYIPEKEDYHYLEENGRWLAKWYPLVYIWCGVNILILTLCIICRKKRNSNITIVV
jgi:hypothetical protein